MEKGYHGKQAAGTHLYLGKYKVDEETPEQTLGLKTYRGLHKMLTWNMNGRKSVYGF